MWKQLCAGALGVMLLGSSGCVYITAVRSLQGKAFVAKASPLGGSFWNCDATSGEPVCYQVSEVNQPSK